MRAGPKHRSGNIVMVTKAASHEGWSEAQAW